MKTILLLDNYDSFTYNLADYLERTGAQVRVWRNDQCSIDDIKKLAPAGIVLSPGPCRPADAGILMELIEAVHASIPLLGVCLGHQGIGEFFGAKLIKANVPMHGKTSLITHQQIGVFDQLPSPLEVMRYHSLILESLADTPLQVTAETDSGEIMAFRHQSLPIEGVQFHPESILTQYGVEMIANFVARL
jgi:anthranilate synthase/aminodeoxychorismate synthase-like glutamine amidotransferase